MRFSYDQAMEFLSKGEVARREDWPLTDCIQRDGERLVRGDAVFDPSEADMKATDWVVYRRS